MAVDRRLAWVGATLVVAIAAVLMARSRPEAPPVAPVRRAAPANPAMDATNGSAPPALNLDALRATRDAPEDAGRDPFRFRPKVVPSPASPQRIPGVPDDQAGAPVVRVPTGPPPPPPITLKFIGLVQKADGTRIAVLSDGKRPISGTEGEEIEGRYKILKIGTESIEIAYIDGRGRQTLRLTGQ